MTSKGYTRLPGGLRGFLRRNSTWAAGDHVLLVSGTRFQERYHRVYYRDVVAVIIQRARRFTAPWYWFVLLVILAISGFVSANTPRTQRFLPAIAFGAAGLLVLCSVGFALLASCRVWVVTAVGNVAVPGVARIWQARRFVKALQTRTQPEGEAIPS